jgi:D-arginine dehydrogenase
VQECDILVIGAGVAGASAAYELAASGRVVVLERESAPGYHTTGRSAALYTESYGSPVVRALTLASKAFFDAPPEDFAEHALLTPRGALFVAREDQLAALDRTLAEAKKLVPSVRAVNAAEALEISPALRPEYVAAGVFEPDAMDMDVHAIHGGFLKGLRRRGGEVVTGAGVTALTRDRKTWIAETPMGAFAAPIVVNAAGAWCDEIAKLAGVAPVGLVPKRRTAITFDAPDGTDISSWPLTIDVEEGFYFKPEAGRILASPADETPSPPCDAQPEEIDVALIVDRFERAVCFPVRAITHKWAGLRSFVADNTPVVGMAGDAEGFLWLTGQGGYGIMTSPAMGSAAAALIETGALPGHFARFGLTESALSPRRLG